MGLGFPVASCTPRYYIPKISLPKTPTFLTWARLLSEHPGAWFGSYSPSQVPGTSSARSVPPLQAVTRRTKVAPTKRMSRFLKHFTVVGDDYHTWNVNYKKWENEEEEEEPAPTSAEGEGNAAGPDAEAGSASTPRQSLDFRSRLRKLFSSHRFQVRE